MVPAAVNWHLAALSVTSKSHKETNQRVVLVSQGRGFPLPGGKTGWPGNASLEAFSGLQVSEHAKMEVVLQQFSIFSLLCFAQHPMALKPEEKSEKRSAYFLSPIPYAIYLSHIPSYSLLLYRKEISWALYDSSKGESQPCELPTWGWTGKWDLLLTKDWVKTSTVHPTLRYCWKEHISRRPQLKLWKT